MNKWRTDEVKAAMKIAPVKLKGGKYGAGGELAHLHLSGDGITWAWYSRGPLVDGIQHWHSRREVLEQEAKALIEKAFREWLDAKTDGVGALAKAVRLADKDGF